MKCRLLLCAAVFFAPSVGLAQFVVPGAADVQRVTPAPEFPLPNEVPNDRDMQDVLPLIDGGEEAEFGSVVLRGVRVEGVNAFDKETVEKIYAPYIDTEVTAEDMRLLTRDVTQLYRTHRYFLSRAYLPEQSVQDGIITIRVVEGYVSNVTVASEVSDLRLVRAVMDDVRAQKPITAEYLESALLRLNDIPGHRFSGVLRRLYNAPEGAVELYLEHEKADGQGQAAINNYGSRFLGPYQGSLSYSDSFIDQQQTTLVASTSIPTDELNYIALAHAVPITPRWNIEFNGSYADSEPGSNLEQSDIENSSIELGLRVTYQPIRQRLENLRISLGIDGQNTNGDILNNNPLTRDRRRAARLAFDYDTNDSWYGYNYLNVTLSKGLDIFSASQEGDANLSRAEGDPEFSAVAASYTRQQAISKHFLAILDIAGQYSDDALLSSEEFGFGGQRFGRAYDPSEITGDSGAAAAIELRYTGIKRQDWGLLTPYAFYDVGKVWNEDTGGVDQSAASAGLGVRFDHDTGVTMNVGLAFPLTRDVDTPLNGHDRNPRINFQVGYAF